MTPMRVLLLLALALPAVQEASRPVRVELRDGQVLMGTLSVESFKIDSSLGQVDVAVANLKSIRFEGDSVVASTKEGSSFKGKLALESLPLKTLLGDIPLKREAMAVLSPMGSALPPKPIDPKTHSVVGQVRTTDNTEVKGTLDLASLTLESKLGKFDINAGFIGTVSRIKDKDDWVVTLRDSGLLQGKITLEALKIKSAQGEFTIKKENLAGFTVLEFPPIGGAPVPPQGPRPGPPSAPAKPAVAAAAKASVQGVLGQFQVTPSGGHVYAVNASDGKLCRWKLPDLAPDGEVELTGGETAFSLDSTGTKGVAVGERTVTMVTLDPFKATKTFSVEQQILDAHILDGDTLLAVGNQGSYIISISKTAIIQRFMNGSTRLDAVAGGTRIYGTTGFFSIESAPGGPRVEWIGSMMNPGGNAPLEMSGNGRYGVSCFDGRVYRLGKCWAAGKVFAAQIERCAAAAFTPDGATMYTLNDQGFLTTIATDTFQVGSSKDLGVRASQAAVVDGGKSLLVAGGTEADGSRGRSKGRNSVNGRIVDLYRFDLPR